MTTTTSTQPHVLVVTANPPADGWHAWDGCADCRDDPDFTVTIECSPGQCPTTWWQCAAGEHDIDAIHDTGMAHGVPHMVFSGVACVETSRCYVQVGAWYGTAAWDVATEPGRFLVDYDGGPLEDFQLHVIAAEGEGR